MCVRTRQHSKMDLQEKFAFARKNPVYDAIPLVVLHKGEKKNYENGKTTLYYQIKLYFLFI